MMLDVSDETLHNKYFFLYSLSFFYSRIVLRKLNPIEKSEFRKVERTHNQCNKYASPIALRILDFGQKWRKC